MLIIYNKNSSEKVNLIFILNNQSLKKTKKERLLRLGFFLGIIQALLKG